MFIHFGVLKEQFGRMRKIKNCKNNFLNFDKKKKKCIFCLLENYKDFEFVGIGSTVNFTNSKDKRIHNFTILILYISLKVNLICNCKKPIIQVII